MSNLLPSTSGTPATRGVRLLFSLGSLLVGIGAVSGCMYTLQAGAGLPPDAEIMAVEPFDNETGRFEITQEVQDALQEELPRSFGVRPGGQDVADVLVRGTIRTYNVQSALHERGEERGQGQVLERRVTLAVAVEIIDLEENVILWDDTNISVEGEFAAEAGTEEEGRAEAIERMVERIVDGIQSQW